MSRPRTLSDLFSDIARLLCAVGKLVKERREAYGFTRRELGKETGLPITTIREMEAGTIADLEAWAKLLAHPSMRGLPEQARREGIVRTFRRNGHNGVGQH